MNRPRHSNGRGWRAALALRALLLPALAFTLAHTASSGGKEFISFRKGENDFTLASSRSAPPLCASSRDFPGVLRVVKYLQTDLRRVADAEPRLWLDSIPRAKEILLVGTLGKSPVLDRLVRDKKVDAAGIRGEWEAYLIQTVEKPLPGVDRALVIAGSDKRGTIYGMLEISRRIGVSPWYWWADVPPQRHPDIFVLPGRHTDGPPSVRYRGIFLNDEYPALTNWIRAKYGTLRPSVDPPIPPGIAAYGHEFYERIFELLLRLKANYLWPAMWDNAFNEDDPENPKLADEYGIVMGASHQEPMLRAQKEWDRRYLKRLGTWNYATAPETLETFWRQGIRRNREYESIITIGLRGANDTPMAPGGPEANMALLERIVAAQRKIIAEETGRDITRVPQLWCLYKEVQEFYQAGMRVPDDVTLLWADDNWGNLRRLPTAEERRRSGGAGIYYHFDYHGSPRSYQWLNTNTLAKIWDQMSMAKEYGADRIWIVNVGHLKGYELPIEYFMDLAWNSKEWTNERIGAYARSWAERQFGVEHAGAIAEVLAGYTKYNGRRKPELLSPSTYSLVNYQEADEVVAGFNAVAAKAEGISAQLPAPSREAFYELVLFPAKASALVNELYVTAEKNALYAKQGRAATNRAAEETRALFAADTALMGHFNRTLAGGKWEHFMDQTHLGYTTWQDPPENTLRAIPLKELDLPDAPAMGIALEGSESTWPGGAGYPVLPPIDLFNRQQRYVEVFNRGKTPFTYAARADRPWISLSASGGEVREQARVMVSVDWTRAPAKSEAGTVIITGAGGTVSVGVEFSPPREITPGTLRGFIESEGCVSMEAAHFTAKKESGRGQWIQVEEYGHTLSAMRGKASPGAPAAEPGKDSPCLEYRMYLPEKGKVEVEGIFGATLNFMPGRPLRYGISFDGDPPRVVTLVPANFIAQHGNMEWEKIVGDNARRSSTSHAIASKGYHTLKIWLVDPGVILEKIIVDLGGVRPSYLGPPESFRRDARGK